MCGRFVITTPPDVLRELFGYLERPNFPPRFNISPTQPIPVVTGDRERHFRLMRWGLWPAWVKDPRKFTLLINARAETIREKPAFKNAIRRRRGLIPADGYYEWQSIDGGKRRPYFIHRRDGRLIGFAAVAETWVGPNGEEVDTVAIVTAAASADLAALHSRVPVTIEPRDFERWLDCRSDEADSVMPLMRGPEVGEFVWHEISSRVNHVTNDDAQLILPITEQEREAEQSKPVKKSSPRKAASPDIDDGQGSLF